MDDGEFLFNALRNWINKEFPLFYADGSIKLYKIDKDELIVEWIDPTGSNVFRHKTDIPLFLSKYIINIADQIHYIHDDFSIIHDSFRWIIETNYLDRMFIHDQKNRLMKCYSKVAKSRLCKFEYFFYLTFPFPEKDKGIIISLQKRTYYFIDKKLSLSFHTLFEDSLINVVHQCVDREINVSRKLFEIAIKKELNKKILNIPSYCDILEEMVCTDLVKAIDYDNGHL